MNFTVNLYWKVLCKSNTECLICMITKSQDSKLKLSTNFYISVQKTMNIVVHCYNCILKNVVAITGTYLDHNHIPKSGKVRISWSPTIGFPNTLSEKFAHIKNSIITHRTYLMQLWHELLEENFANILHGSTWAGL